MFHPPYAYWKRFKGRGRLKARVKKMKREEQQHRDV
jgi:hypothetical protein